MRIEVAYRLPAFWRHDQTAKVFVSWCPPLGIFSQGESEAQAKHALESAVALYIKTCHKRGILDRQLKLRGARPVSPGECGELMENEDSHFISVQESTHEEEESYDGNRFDVNVNIDLLVAQKFAMDRKSGSVECGP